MSDLCVTVVFSGNLGGRGNLTEDDQVLMHEVDSHMNRVWASEMQDWQKELIAADSNKGTIAFVTRDCRKCGSRVRVGVLISPSSSNRPAGERAYCATYKKLTLSTVVAL